MLRNLKTTEMESSYSGGFFLLFVCLKEENKSVQCNDVLVDSK